MAYNLSKICNRKQDFHLSRDYCEISLENMLIQHIDCLVKLKIFSLMIIVIKNNILKDRAY